jgi:hypothetical protein
MTCRVKHGSRDASRRSTRPTMAAAAVVLMCHLNQKFEKKKQKKN